MPLSNLKFLQVTRQSFILHLSSLNSSLTGILQDSKRIHLYFYYNPRHVSWASFTKNVQRSSRGSLRIAWNPNPSLAVDLKIHRSVPSAALFCFATPSRILWMGLKTLRDSSETVWNSEDSSSFFWDCLEILIRALLQSSRSTTPSHPPGSRILWKGLKMLRNPSETVWNSKPIVSLVALTLLIGSVGDSFGVDCFSW